MTVLPPPPTTSPNRRRPPVLRGFAALTATVGLLGGLAVVAAGPAAAESPDTAITELALDTSPGESTTSAQRRSTEQSQTGADAPSPLADGEQVLAELPEQDVEDFSTLGVTWDADSTGPAPTVEFRTRTDRTWTGWTTIEDDGVESGQTTTADAEGATRIGTDPIYVGESDGVQIRLSGDAETSVSDPQVALIQTSQVAADENLQVTAAAAAAPGLAPRPGYISRKGWGADEDLKQCGTYEDDTIKAAIVHHTAGVNSYSESQSASIVRGILAYHTRTLGWCDIGYNFLIDKYGNIFEGRSGGVDKPVHGAHATDWNTDTVGISFMGNFETASAPRVMLESGAAILAWKFDAYYLDANSKLTLAGKYINRISGHGDVMSTACPGVNVRSQMGWLRDRVATIADGGPTPIENRWRSLGADSSPMGMVYIGETDHVGGRVTKFDGYDMFSSEATGARWTKGAIRTKYRAMGAARHRVGFPVGDESANWPQRGVSAQRFEEGLILWASKTGAHSVEGAFAQTYDDSYDLRSTLRAPVTDKQVSGFGNASQTFAGGRMFYAGGVQVINGGFYQHYRDMSASARLKRGYPIESKQLTTGGVPTQRLSSSTFYWLDGGVREVTGRINTTYQAQGAETGRLGFPTASVRKGAGDTWYSTFEGGRLTLQPNGTVSASYR